MSRLVAGLGASFFAHASVAVASLLVPVLAPELQSTFHLDGRYVGFYSSLVYAFSFLSALLSVDLIARVGPVRMMAMMLGSAAIGLLILFVHAPAALFVSALALGVAFGPANPASSVLLDRISPPRIRGLVFSIKQCSVPLGGFLVAAAAPFIYRHMGMNGVIAISLLLCLAVLGGILLVDSAIGYPPSTGRPRWSLKATFGVFGVFATNTGLRDLALVAAGLAAVQYTFSATIVLVLVRYAGFTTVGAGAVLSCVMIVSILTRIVMGWISDAADARSVLIAVASLLAGSCFAFPFIVSHAPQLVVAATTIVFGTVTLSWNGIVLSALAEFVPHEKVGAATAGNMAVSLIGGVGGPAIFTLILTATDLPSASYWILGLCPAAALMLSTRLPRRGRSASSITLTRQQK